MENSLRWRATLNGKQTNVNKYQQMLTKDSKPILQFQSQVAEQADTASKQLVALSYSAISSNPKTVSVVSKLQFTQASISSHSWLSKQLQLVQSSKLVVAGLSFPELGTAQPQLVLNLFTWCLINPMNQYNQFVIIKLIKVDALDQMNLLRAN